MRQQANILRNLGESFDPVKRNSTSVKSITEIGAVGSATHGADQTLRRHQTHIHPGRSPFTQTPGTIPGGHLDSIQKLEILHLLGPNLRNQGFGGNKTLLSL